MPDLKETIAAANTRAGLSRQRVYAKKAHLKQSDAQVIEMLCDRAEELIAEGKSGTIGKTVFPRLAEAVRIARKRLEAGR